MARLAGFIVGGLATWIFGFSLAGLLGSWWWVGLLLPFLVGYTVTASSLQGILTGLVREGIFSSAMLRPVKGFAADVLVWALSLWIIWKLFLVLWFLFPGVFGPIVANVTSNWIWWIFDAWLAWSYVRSLSVTLKIFIGRSTRPFRRLFRGFSFGQGGSSRFNGLLEEWANPWKPGMLLLGTSLHSRGWKVGVPDDRHFITIATSRSGKGRSGIIPNLLTWPGSALVIDPKGQNAAVTMQARRKMGQAVYVVDPFHELEAVGIDPRGTRFRFNPMAELRPDDLDIVEQCGQLADALIKPDPRAAAFWLDSAKQLLVGLIAHVLTSPKIPDDARTLETMRWLLGVLGDKGFMQSLRDNDQAGGLPRQTAAQLDALGETARGDIIATAMEQTKWLDSLAMRDCLGASEFSLADLKTKAMTVYLVLPPQYLDEHGRFLRLFVNLSITVASRGRKPRNSVLFVLDEFYALGTMNLLSKSAGLLAGFGVKLWPIVQNIGQLKELYPENWETFLGNAGLWQVFAANDDTTARYLSERLGHHIAWRKVRGPDGGYEWMPQGATFLRTSVEFAQESGRESGNQVVFQEGGSAFLLRRAPYDRMFKLGKDYEADPFEPAPSRRLIGGIAGIPDFLRETLLDRLDQWAAGVDDWFDRRRQKKAAAKIAVPRKLP